MKGAGSNLGKHLAHEGKPRWRPHNITHTLVFNKVLQRLQNVEI